MSIFRGSSIGSFTRGGQTTLHYIRMVLQVVKQFTFWVLMIILLLFGTILYVKTTSYERSVMVDYGLAHLAVRMSSDPDHRIAFTLEDGRTVDVRPAAIIQNEGVQAIVASFYRDVAYSTVICFFTFFGLLIWGVRFMTLTGEDQAEEEFLRGGSLVPVKDLKQAIKDKKEPLGTVSIGGVRLPKASEPAGILLCGGPGTGKSQIFLKALSEIRAAGQPAIVYDVAGSFIEAFYDPSRDVILNPLDKRSKPWNVWADAESVWEYDSLAESLIPDKAQGNDPMWALAARKVFVEICKQLKREGRTTNQALTSTILTIPKEELFELLKQTEAASLLDKDATKVVTSVRIMLASYSQSMTYLHDAGEPFSIRKWVQDPKKKGWIFVSTKADQKAALRPLITCWMDIAASAVLSIPPSRQRRIWLSLDELPTMNKLPSLLNTMTNSRKYGGCTIIGFQSYPQMCEIYEKHGADAISEGCSTWGILRANGDITGEWGSKGLGKTEVNETSEGLSYGAHEIRDGVNLTKNRRTREIVMSTELTNLPDLHGYLRLGRKFPVAHFVLKYKEYPSVAEEFILREGAGDIDRDFSPPLPAEDEPVSAFARVSAVAEIEDEGSALTSFVPEAAEPEAPASGSPSTPVAGDAPRQESLLPKDERRSDNNDDLITSL
jgi:type IV conjugative transfer system coupling protein TraD